MQRHLITSARKYGDSETSHKCEHPPHIEELKCIPLLHFTTEYRVCIQLANAIFLAFALASTTFAFWLVSITVAFSLVSTEFAFT